MAVSNNQIPAEMPPGSVLEVKGLTVSYLLGKSWQPVLRDIDFSIHTGEKYGIVGESGSGKTTLALSILGYLGEGGRVDEGSIVLDGIDLCGLDESGLRETWGKKVAFVPQDTSASLNPTLRVGKQMTELLEHQLGLIPKDATKKARDLLDSIHIVDPDRILRSYPHQISGGMKQRVLIAMALSTEPHLLILDEPTTGLDVTTQAAVLILIREVVKNRKTAVLYVSHNLSVIGNLCDRVSVLYAGELVEDARVRPLFSAPLHPYTSGLLASIPQLGKTGRNVQFSAMAGHIPPLGERPTGCVFRPRCPLAVEICLERPDLFISGRNRFSRCHRWEEIAAGEIEGRTESPKSPNPAGEISGDRILSIQKLSVPYPIPRTLREVVQRAPQRNLWAVRDISLDLFRGSTLGLVGESGSGKTTFARAIAGLIGTSEGHLELLSIQLPFNIDDRGVETLKNLQMVFQNPEEALNPYLTIRESLSRPLIRLLGKPPAESEKVVVDLLKAVRLPSDYINRLPGQLSGGEQQRVAIARAIASNPGLLLFDEPISSLDVSVQASILNLLADLQATHQFSQIFISHDLAVVGAISDFVAVIYLGRLMEVSSADSLFAAPFHPYTEALLQAVPRLDRIISTDEYKIQGEIPEISEQIKGCPFQSRCPRFLGEICKQQTPPWHQVSSGKRIFCHIPPEELEILQEGLEFVPSNSRDAR